jgi:hypothetical protein
MISIKVNRAVNGFVFTISRKKQMRLYTKRFIASDLDDFFANGDLQIQGKFDKYPNTRAYLTVTQHHGGYLQNLWFRGTELRDLFRQHKSVIKELGEVCVPQVVKLIDEAFSI